MEEKYLPNDYDEERMKKEFEESYKILCATNEPFHIKMQKIFEMKKINAAVFVDRTELNRNYYGKFKSA